MVSVSISTTEWRHGQPPPASPRNRKSARASAMLLAKAVRVLLVVSAPTGKCLCSPHSLLPAFVPGGCVRPSPLGRPPTLALTPTFLFLHAAFSLSLGLGCLDGITICLAQVTQKPSHKYMVVLLFVLWRSLRTPPFFRS